MFWNVRFSDSYISEDNMFQDVPIYFLIFVEVCWYNKNHKYGAPAVGKSRNHEILSVDVYNNEIGILLCQSEAEKNN